MSISRIKYEKWLKTQSYEYKTLNPYCPDNGYPFSTSKKDKNFSHLASSNRYFMGGYNLRDKYAINSESRYEDFYICGEDLKNAFNANDGYIDQLEIEVKELRKKVSKCTCEHN